MHDILKPHWQPSFGSAAVRETTILAEPPLFTDAKTHYNKD